MLPLHVCARRFTLRGAVTVRSMPAPVGGRQRAERVVDAHAGANANLAVEHDELDGELVERLVVAGVLVRDDAHLLLVPAVELELALRLLDG